MASPPSWDCSSSGGVAGEKCERNKSWSLVEYTDAVQAEALRDEVMYGSTCNMGRKVEVLCTVATIAVVVVVDSIGGKSIADVVELRQILLESASEIGERDRFPRSGRTRSSNEIPSEAIRGRSGGGLWRMGPEKAMSAEASDPLEVRRESETSDGATFESERSLAGRGGDAGSVHCPEVEVEACGDGRLLGCDSSARRCSSGEREGKRVNSFVLACGGSSPAPPPASRIHLACSSSATAIGSGLSARWIGIDDERKISLSAGRLEPTGISL